ncbi:MAG: tRNA (N6-threonylcarbamoyladenosine(37)-N6)-methyltransferase TrmO [Candidatus Altiarchaeales archaeon]|nr:tRNA (N6-threonylcarbamoyladenosine(37)-N6)-methyltransferase TrmO [Candidatus Altiarchaeales archaeon]MBD3417316.1 tRNA (N6-threonylcarbamoyladenosine(37)-N6)-methyltransferase TrmO [Candidatus Altiarchaeales archaeon]
MREVKLKPIGVIHTPYKNKEGIPIQGGLHEDSKGTVEVFKEYSEGLLSLEGFSHIMTLYVFHKSSGYNLKQKPFLDDMEHGVFSIRSPRRPNPIGVTIVRLDRVEDNILHVSGVDMVDETPLLDIKPHVPEFDTPERARIGWLQGKIKGKHLSDSRFSR